MARLNWSTLKHLATSPKLLAWRVEHPQPDTPALRLGRAIHCAILEPEEYPKRWVTAGKCEASTKAGEGCRSQGSLYLDGNWFCGVRGHAPPGAGVPPDGLEIIAAEDVEIVKFCADSVKAHAVASRLLSGGKAEQEIEWTNPESGIACRGRVDYLKPTSLLDLKSTRKETVREFVRDAAANLYYGQLAWYHDGAIAAGRLSADAAPPQIIAVSTAEPYDVAPFELAPFALEAGRILYRDLLIKYQQCVASGLWPGIAPDLQVLDLPTWARGMNGSEETEAW